MSDQSQPPTWGEQPPSGSTPPPPPPPPGGPYDSGSQGYGAAPQQGQGYGDPYAGQGYAGGLGYASWFQRVGAYLVDVLTLIPAYVVIGIGVAVGASGARTVTDPTTGMTSVEGGNSSGILIALVGYVLIFAIMIWNVIWRQGRTGWSIGKQVVGIRLLKESDGQPMGAGMNFVRQIVHILDSLACMIGYLWPLWDDKRQTFADKIMQTVVVQQRKS